MFILLKAANHQSNSMPCLPFDVDHGVFALKCRAWDMLAKSPTEVPTPCTVGEAAILLLIILFCCSGSGVDFLPWDQNLNLFNFEAFKGLVGLPGAATILFLDIFLHRSWLARVVNTS